ECQDGLRIELVDGLVGLLDRMVGRLVGGAHRSNRPSLRPQPGGRVDSVVCRVSIGCHSRLLDSRRGRCWTLARGGHRTRGSEQAVRSRPAPAWRVGYARPGRDVMGKQRRYSEKEFEELVGAALDELPGEFQRVLEGVAVV